MILDEHDGHNHTPTPPDIHDGGPDGLEDGGWDDLDDGDGDGGGGEWLGGLRRAGLPVTTPKPRPAVAAPTSPALVVLDGAVADLIDRSWAPSTRTSYQADWLWWAAWCDTHGIEPLAAEPEDVARWAASLTARRLTLATIRRRLAGIANAYHLAGLTSPTNHPLVRRTVAGAARTLGTTQRRATPLRLEQLRHIMRAAPIVRHRDRPDIVRRDTTLLAIGWAAALRRSELVALDAEDLTFTGSPDTHEGGLVVRVRTSKTSTTEAHIAIPWSTHSLTCPARAAFHHTRKMRTGPLFRAIDRHGHTHNRLAPNRVSTIIKQAIATFCTDQDPTSYSAHSLRAGFVTEARANRVPDALIARHTRHTDPRMLQVYDRPTDLFNDPALAGEWW